MDRRKFLKGVAAGVTAALAPSMSQINDQLKPITASEVMARNSAYLKECEEKIREAMMLSPDFVRDLYAYGRAALNTPDGVNWFSLEPGDTDDRRQV